MRGPALIAAFVSILFSTPAAACDYYDTEIQPGLRLVLYPKGSASYYYGVPPYKEDNYQLELGLPLDRKYRPLNLTLKYPQSPRPEGGLSADPTWSVLAFWRPERPVDGSILTISGDGVELARFAGWKASVSDGVSDLYTDKPLAKARLHRKLTATVIQPDGTVYVAQDFVMPDWNKLKGPIRRGASRLKAVAKSENGSLSKECGAWPIAD